MDSVVELGGENGDPAWEELSPSGEKAGMERLLWPNGNDADVGNPENRED